MNNLCELAYPSSLTERMDKNVVINEDSYGEILGVNGWNFERFKVVHDDFVDPNGYVFTHSSGFK